MNPFDLMHIAFSRRPEKAMKIKSAAKLFRVTERTLLDECRHGKFGARKIKGDWVLTRPPCLEPMITVQTVAESIYVTPGYVRRLCEEGRIMSIYIGRQRRIPLSEATKFTVARLTGFQQN
jgi:excisionase family DNA binding protein